MCAPSLLPWHPGTLISLWAQPLTLGTQLDLWFNKQMISPFHSIACSAMHLCGQERGTKRCVGVKSAGPGFPSALPLGDRSVQTSPAQPLGKRTPSSARWFFGPRGPAPEFQMKRHGRLEKNGNVSQVADGLKCLPWPSVVKRHFLGWERCTCHW